MVLREAKDDRHKLSTPGMDIPMSEARREPRSAVPYGFVPPILALLSAIAACIHASVFHHHHYRLWMIGAFFLIVAFTEGLWAFMLWRRPSRSLLIWGIGLHTGVALVWLASRVTGVSMVVGVEGSAPIGLAVTVATGAAIVIVIGAVVLLRRADMRPAPDPSGLPAFVTLREAAILSDRPLDAISLLRGDGTLLTRPLLRGTDDPASTFVPTEALRRAGLLEPVQASGERRTRGEDGRTRGWNAIAERLLWMVTTGALAIAALSLVGGGPDLATNNDTRAASRGTGADDHPHAAHAELAPVNPSELSTPLLSPARSPLELGADTGPDCTAFPVPGEIAACGTEAMGGGATTWVVERTERGCCTVRILASADGGWVESLRGTVPGIDVEDVRVRAADLTGDGNPELIAGITFSEPEPSLTYEIVLHEAGSPPRIGLHSWGRGGVVKLGDGSVEQYLAQYPITDGCCEEQTVINELLTYVPAQGADHTGSARAGRLQVDRAISQSAPGGDPCCPSSFLRLVIRWNGSSFGWSEAEQVDPSVVPASDL